MSKIIKSSGNTIEPYWPALFAKALKGQNVGELLSNIGSAGAGGAVAGDAGAGAGAAVEVAKEEEKKEEEEDVDMGGLFGDDEDY